MQDYKPTDNLISTTCVPTWAGSLD